MPNARTLPVVPFVQASTSPTSIHVKVVNGKPQAQSASTPQHFAITGDCKLIRGTPMIVPPIELSNMPTPIKGTGQTLTQSQSLPPQANKYPTTSFFNINLLSSWVITFVLVNHFSLPFVHIGDSAGLGEKLVVGSIPPLGNVTSKLETPGTLKDVVALLVLGISRYSKLSRGPGKCRSQTAIPCGVCHITCGWLGVATLLGACS